MDDPIVDPIVVVAWISSIFGFLNILVGSVFTYLAVLQNNKKKQEEKDKTLPMKPVDIGKITELEQLRKEDQEAYAISIGNKEKQIQDLNDIIAAHQLWNLKLTRQLKRYGITPAEYEPPAEYE